MSMSDFSQHVPLSTFLQAHPDQGSLRVQVASGGGTFPGQGWRYTGGSGARPTRFTGG